jgi:hypothetical protein
MFIDLRILGCGGSDAIMSLLNRKEGDVMLTKLLIGSRLTQLANRLLL